MTGQIHLAGTAFPRHASVEILSNHIAARSGMRWF
jgi:hypothetical protein